MNQLDHFLNFQELFKGFQNTPLLWKSSAVYKFEQFPIEPTTEKFVEKSEHKKLRLGKWVEKFVTFQLQQNANINILEENLIIKDGKQTIGELDVFVI